jgi:hypothetical protein
MSDDLLEWMSYAGQGSIDDLPQELAGAGTARRRLIDNFVTLGHAEMLTASAWRIAVPCLAELPMEPAGRHAAILCGARTPGVLQRLTAACESGAGTLRNAAAGDLPSVFEVECSTRSDLRRVAARADIALQDDAAFTLLACLPAISSWPRQSCPMIGGRVGDVRRFSRDRLQWEKASLEEASNARSGFFRIQREYDWVSLLKVSQSESATIDDRAGRLFAAAKLRAVSWRRDELSLRVPTQLMPPAPISRALALCSGKPPGFDRKTHQLVFEGVNAAMLRLTLAITGLRLI